MRIQLATRALLVPNLSSPPEGSTLAAIPTSANLYRRKFANKYAGRNIAQKLRLV